MQQIIANKHTVTAYGSENVVAGASVMMCSMLVMSAVHKPVGLMLGIGVSDVTAWAAGVSFDVLLDGNKVLEINDQIGDLLRPEFWSLPLINGQRLEIVANNNAAAALDIAVFARVEVL